MAVGSTTSHGWAPARPRVVRGVLLGGLTSLVVSLLVAGPVLRMLVTSDVSVENAARLITVGLLVAPLVGGAVGAWQVGGGPQDHRVRIVAGLAGPMVVGLGLALVGLADGSVQASVLNVIGSPLFTGLVAGLAAFAVSWWMGRR